MTQESEGRLSSLHALPLLLSAHKIANAQLRSQRLISQME